MSNDMKSALDAATKEADKAVKDWLSKRKDIAGEITKLLDGRVQEIVGKLLGFVARFRKAGRRLRRKGHSLRRSGQT